MESQPVRSWWHYSVRREMFWDSSMTVSLLKANLDRKQIFETDLVRDTETNSIPAETDVLTTIHFIVIAAVVILPDNFGRHESNLDCPYARHNDNVHIKGSQ